MPDAIPAGFKAGYVALVGRPNAGKSTLLNALLRFKLSIVSSKPQTTRHRILGLMNGKEHQVCFLDTPGLLDETRDLLQGALVRSARRAVREDADIVVALVEPGTWDRASLERLRALIPNDKPVLLTLTKADLVGDRKKLEAEAAAAAGILRPRRSLVISALKGEGLEELRAAIVDLLPASPPYFDPGQLSDRWERFFVSEIIREGLFDLYHQELPHACAVEIEDFKEAKGRPDLIRAVIYCERPNQKGILLGRQGRALEQLRRSRIPPIERFLGRRVELDLWVKVRANWRKDPAALRLFGYD